MMLWSKPKTKPECECVCPNSPARLLAKSLTDPETRGEWASKAKIAPYCVGFTYTNTKRDLTVSRHSGMGGSWVLTPFTLNDAEKEIVREATLAFDKWERETAEEAALARLTAPKRRRK